MLVKKYSNRRLYDTEESRYITLDELTDKVRRGADVQIVDAKSGEDLTQATLTQIILESKAARLLPTHLLARLIRMQDDALAEFFGKYMSGALELYLTAKQGAQAVAPYFPFATMPFTAGNAFARMMSGVPVWGEPNYAVAAPPPPPPPSREPTPAPAPPGRGELDALKGELEALKREMRKKRR
jgi:polyhydroxyalkanoate synthesis repressor PhaR